MQQTTESERRSFIARLLSAENLAGDVRTAVIGSATGSIIGIVFAAVTTVLLAKAPLDYTVFLNDEGAGQPKPLFDLAEKTDRKLKLQFSPAGLRSVYVCEFRRVTGANYRTLVLQYLDTYRDCFDVSARGESSFQIGPNLRSSRLIQKEGVFLCQCETNKASMP
jgi:hypothetical protein